MIRKLTILAVILMQFGVASVYAVTDKEMEQARVIAAKTYLRYANDGSGYLDDIKPKSMADLESRIKPKEKENLKAFKAVGLPKDYASWDKAKLVEYWSVTFFKSPGLTEKGKMARARVRKNIGNMTVTPPQSEAEKKAAQTKAEAEKKAAENEKIAEAKGTSESQEAVSGESSAADENKAIDAISDSIGNVEKKAADLEMQGDDIKEEKSHTWIYILVLAVLVGVVVWLVTFASNVMKKNQNGQDERVRSEEDRLAERQANEASKEMREKFAATLVQKNADISQLNAKVEHLNHENQSLKRDMEVLVAETGSLRTRLSDAQRQLEEIRQAASSAMAAPVSRHAEGNGSATQQPVAASRQTEASEAVTHQRRARTIYLGRVNTKGIFVRADRELNIGNSIYALETTDGYAGTYRVVADPTVWEMALLTPQQSLMGGCMGEDLDLPEGNAKVVTDSPGTAVFEGGCWRVIRKARIHYE